MSDKPWSKQEFEQKLRAKGVYYHIYHPFHIAMNKGECSKEQIQGWVANRFYYQVCIPVKDAAVLANCPDMDPAASGSNVFLTTTEKKAIRVWAVSKPG